MVKCRRGVAGARYAWARPRPPALEVKNPTQAEGLEKYKEMSILGLLCLLCALVAGLFLVLYGLQRRDLKSLELLSRLCHHGPLSIARLSEGSQITRQGVTKHLQALADAGLVRGTREGRERIWELEPERIEDAQHCLAQISEQWDSAILRLQDFLSKNP